MQAGQNPNPVTAPDGTAGQRASGVAMPHKVPVAKQGQLFRRFWRDFLTKVGPVHGFAEEKTFTAAATFGAFSGASIGWMVHIIDWFENQGLPPETARALIAATLRGNAEVLLREDRPLDDIARSVVTPGGISEMVLATLSEREALEAWDAGLDRVLKRIGG